MKNSKRMINQMISETDGKNLTWDERFLKIAEEISTWSTCVRKDKSNGAVIVKDNKILATGYNGSPEGVKPCSEKGYCYRKMKNIESGTKLDECFAIHAEQSAIMNAAREGVGVEGSTLYVLRQPCTNCLKFLISAGIKKVVYAKENYTNQVYEDILNESGIEMVNLLNKEEE